MLGMMLFLKSPSLREADIIDFLPPQVRFLCKYFPSHPTVIKNKQICGISYKVLSTSNFLLSGQGATVNGST